MPQSSSGREEAVFLGRIKSQLPMVGTRAKASNAVKNESSFRSRCGPVAFSRDQEQSDAARNSKDQTVIKHSSVTDVVPQQTSNNACDQFQKSDNCAVPADGTGAQEFWHEVRSKCLADRPKYSLES